MGPFGNNPGVTGGTNFILDTRNRTWNASLTKVQGRHTLKSGYYYFRSLQRRGAGNVTGNINFGNDANNPLDTTFWFSNAAIGVFSTYAQTSRWAEGAYLAVSRGVRAGHWRLSSRVTLDYGVRFAHMQPQYDSSMGSARTSCRSSGRPHRRRGSTSRAAPRTCIPARRPTAAPWIR